MQPRPVPGEPAPLPPRLIMQLLKTYHHNFIRHLIEGELQRRIYAMAEQGRPITANLLNRVQGEILMNSGAARWKSTKVPDWSDASNPLLPRAVPVHLLGGAYRRHCSGQSHSRTRGSCRRKWIEVLKLGGTKKPLELSRMAGADMTKPDPIREAVAL